MFQSMFDCFIYFQCCWLISHSLQLRIFYNKPINLNISFDGNWLKAICFEMLVFSFISSKFYSKLQHKTFWNGHFLIFIKFLLIIFIWIDLMLVKIESENLFNLFFICPISHSHIVFINFFQYIHSICKVNNLLKLL